MNKFPITAVAVATLFLVACDSPANNAYGKRGWHDNEDFSQVITTNADGDTLGVATSAFLNNTFNVASVYLKTFEASCKDSEAGKNDAGINLYEVFVSLEFPEDVIANEDIGAIKILHGSNKETGKAAAINFLINQGILFFKDSSLAKLGKYNRMHIVYKDNCNKKFKVKFNTTGDIQALTAGLEGRKIAAGNAAAEKEFEK